MGMDSDSESDSNSEIPNGTGNAYGLWPGENKSQTHPVLATMAPPPNTQIADQLRFSLLGARSTGERRQGTGKPRGENANYACNAKWNGSVCGGVQ